MLNIKKLSSYLSRQNIVMAALVLCLTSVSFLNLALILYKPPVTVEAKTDNINQKINFWTNFLFAHPTYFEGWVELSNLQISNKNYYEAKIAYQKAFEINPNSNEITLLKIKLGL